MIWIGSNFFKTIITSTEPIYLCIILKLKNEMYKLLTSLILKRVWYHLTFIPFIGQYTWVLLFWDTKSPFKETNTPTDLQW